MSNEWFHHSSHVQYIRLSLRTLSNTVFLLREADVVGNAVKIVVRARSPVHTRFHIFFIFYNSFLFNPIKKDVRLERLLLLYAVCSLLSCRVWESLTCRKRRCSRLLIVFSAGNLLVNQRGRVWGGENRKRLISH